MMQATVAERRPLRLRLSDISDIRLPLFFFSVSTEVSAAFLPLYARAASRPEWLSPEIAAAAPLVFYLLAVAALSPVAGPLAGPLRPRRPLSTYAVGKMAGEDGGCTDRVRTGG